MNQSRGASADERAMLTRYVALGLAIIGGIEWLFGRTISRMAASPVLEGFGRDVIQTIGLVGIYLLSPAFVLAVALFFLCILPYGARANLRGTRWAVALTIYLSLFYTLAVVLTGFSVVRRSDVWPSWLTISFNILSLVAVWWLALGYMRKPRQSLVARAGVLLMAIAYTGWYVYVLQENAFKPAGGEAPASILVLNLGEIAAVLTPYVLFAAIAVPNGQWRNGKRWIAPVLLALAFSAGNIADMMANTGFTGVFAIWSLGFNLFLPWPIYALALALFAYCVLTCLSAGERKERFADMNRGLGLLLLPFAGYELQLTYQHLLVVLSLMLLTGIARPFGRGDVAVEKQKESAQMASPSAAHVE